MVTKRRRVVAAPPERVWEVVADPWHLPRWWPRTQRVESVTPEGWTSVLASDRGRTVRADWVVEDQEPPRRRRWHQELEGTPFERLLTLNAVEARLEAVGVGTSVELRVEQKLRGWARFAPFLVKRGTRVQLDEALMGLETIVGDTK